MARRKKTVQWVVLPINECYTLSKTAKTRFSWEKKRERKLAKDLGHEPKTFPLFPQKNRPWFNEDGRSGKKKKKILYPFASEFLARKPFFSEFFYFLSFYFKPFQRNPAQEQKGLMVDFSLFPKKSPGFLSGIFEQKKLNLRNVHFTHLFCHFTCWFWSKKIFQENFSLTFSSGELFPTFESLDNRKKKNETILSSESAIYSEWRWMGEFSKCTLKNFGISFL